MTFYDSKRRQIVDITPTITTSAYASGDQLGDINQVQNVALTFHQEGGVVDQIQIIDKADQKARIDLFLFRSDPSATVSSSDNAAFAISDSGTELISTIIEVFPADYVDMGSQSIAQINGKFPFKVNANSPDLWFVSVTRDTPTYGLSDLTFRFHIDQS